MKKSVSMTGKLKWSGRHDSNVRPPAPKAGALARLSYAPTPGADVIRQKQICKPSVRSPWHKVLAGVRGAHESESTQRLEEQIVEGVLRRLGRADAEVARAVAREVSEAIPGLTSTPERVVITASGRNRRGIVLAVAQAIHDFGGDIRDISQTIVDDFFTMLVVIDIGNAVSRGSSLETLRGRLAIVSKELGVHIVAMHDDMLEAMHSV